MGKRTGWEGKSGKKYRVYTAFVTSLICLASVLIASLWVFGNSLRGSLFLGLMSWASAFLGSSVLESAIREVSIARLKSKTEKNGEGRS